MITQINETLKIWIFLNFNADIKIYQLRNLMASDIPKNWIYIFNSLGKKGRKVNFFNFLLKNMNKLKK